MENLLQKYVEIDAQYKEIFAQREAARSEIVEKMREQGVKKRETAYGIFTRAVKKVWEYSDKIKTREENLKIAKKKEQEKGTAKVKIENQYLVFSEPKAE